MFPRSSLLASLALAAACIAAAPAAAETLADYDGYRVAAYDGIQAWSRQVEGQGFELLLRQNGSVRPLAVPAQGRPYDVALGRDAVGTLLAAYASCPSGHYPAGCRLRTIDLASGRDRPIAGTHATRASEYLPALSHGTLVFARRGRRQDAQNHHIVSVESTRLGSRRPSRALYRSFLIDVDATAVSSAGAAFTIADFRQGHGVGRLYAKPAGERVTLVANTRASTNMWLQTPTFTGGALYWAASDSTATPPSGFVLRCAGHRIRAAVGPPDLDAVAADPTDPAAPLLVSAREGQGQVATLAPSDWRALPHDVLARRCPF
jgi:hypothetical protein